MPNGIQQILIATRVVPREEAPLGSQALSVNQDMHGVNNLTVTGECHERHASTVKLSLPSLAFRVDDNKILTICYQG